MRPLAWLSAAGLSALLATAAGAEPAPLPPLPVLAVGGEGDVLVVWESAGSDGSDSDGSSIQGRRVGADGVPLDAAFQVNSWTTGAQRAPAVAASGAHGFVVIWRSVGADGADRIHGQRLDARGARVGAQFWVDAAGAGGERRAPAVAGSASGRFVVVWESLVGDSRVIRARRFDATGGPAGDAFTVSAAGAGSERAPAVTIDRAGNLFVTWVSAAADGGAPTIQGRRYDAAGAAMGRPFQVSTDTDGEWSHPSVVSDADGFVTVTWSAALPGGGRSRQGRRYDADGVAVGEQFTVTEDDDVPAAQRDSRRAVPRRAA